MEGMMESYRLIPISVLQKQKTTLRYRVLQGESVCKFSLRPLARD
jgi:hypothetical protein